MKQTPGAFFWLIMLLTICPVVDGIAAPVTSVRAGGNNCEGSLMAILTVITVISSLNCVSRKIRLLKGLS